MRHNLDDLRFYPKYHRYLGSEAVNIFSRVPVSIGDTVVIRGVEYVLGASDELKGVAKKALGFDKSVSYYEFTLTRKKYVDSRRTKRRSTTK